MGDEKSEIARLEARLADLERDRLQRGPWLRRAAVAALVVVPLTTLAVPAGWTDFQAGAPIQASDMTARFRALWSTVEELGASTVALDQRLSAQEAGDPACPARYARDASAPSSIIVCKKDDDEVVKVGAGGAAFWIDRYEASLWEGGTQRFKDADDSLIGSTFAKNGQSTAPWVAKSVRGVAPARLVTWFQAAAACRAAGKRLPNGEEWIAAVRGTTDPGSNPGAAAPPTTNTRCVTDATTVRATGDAGTAPASASNCVSDWGVEDMVGNLSEWTGDWYAGNGGPSNYANDLASPWPSGYSGDNADGTWNVNGGAQAIRLGPFTAGIPAAAVRGGSAASVERSGAFALDLNHGPSLWHETIGFRCLLPR